MARRLSHPQLRAEMSKMEILNSYLTERLAAVVREILEAVEATVEEYRRETAQTRVENQKLRERLRDAAGRPGPGAGGKHTQQGTLTVPSTRQHMAEPNS